jgi:hypothetical protein
LSARLSTFEPFDFKLGNAMKSSPSSLLTLFVPFVIAVGFSSVERLRFLSDGMPSFSFSLIYK